MPISRLLKSLDDEIVYIEKTYLDFHARPLANYTKREMSVTGAYTMLCHAEIENYLESWAGRIVERAEKKWKQGKASMPLVHLCTFYQERSIPIQVPVKDIWSEAIGNAISKHKWAIRTNHGIKEKDLCALFIPLGFDVSKIDAVLVGDLSAFGSIRGDHAHKSQRHIRKQNPDPFDRSAKVTGLLKLLPLLDVQLQSFLQTF